MLTDTHVPDSKCPRIDIDIRQDNGVPWLKTVDKIELMFQKSEANKGLGRSNIYNLVTLWNVLMIKRKEILGGKTIPWNN